MSGSLLLTGLKLVWQSSQITSVWPADPTHIYVGESISMNESEYLKEFNLQHYKSLERRVKASDLPIELYRERTFTKCLLSQGSLFLSLSHCL